MKKVETEKKCKFCGKTIDKDSKMGMCPSCINKYGTPVAAAGAGGIMVGLKIAWKNKDKIGKTVIKVGKELANLIKR